MLGLTFGALVALGACGGTSMQGAATQEPATAYLSDYGSQASALQASMKTHAAQMATMAGMNAISPVEQAHLGDMIVHLDGMGHDVAVMGMCTDAQGKMMGTGDMGTLVAQAEAECARHQDAMTHAADMNAAMMEEDTHQVMMATMTGQMMAAHDQMLGGGMMGGGMMGAGNYVCPTTKAP
jgi:hypothetical protein